jgi:opacity protein-like surface antigen
MITLIKTTIISIVLLLSSTVLAKDSGWYSKIGVGYGINQKIKQMDGFKESGFTVETKRNSVLGDLAFGYDINRNLAIDFSFSNSPNYNFNAVYSGKLGSSKLSFKEKALNFMLKATYYFKFNYLANPFLTFGLGFGKNRISWNVKGKNNFLLGSLNLIEKKRGFARMIGFGLSVPITRDVSLEGVYQYSTSGLLINKTYIKYYNGYTKGSKSNHLWNNSFVTNLKVKI